ncbi:hypothetical protein D3C85_1574190 [compost metagenome]
MLPYVHLLVAYLFGLDLKGLVQSKVLEIFCFLRGLVILVRSWQLSRSLILLKAGDMRQLQLMLI